MNYKKHQQGFTLIELVMVIVVLGILSSMALPKFASMQKEARIATIQGALGAVQSAKAIVHAKALLEGDPGLATDTVTLETGPAATVFNYPAVASLASAVDLTGFDVTAGVISVKDPAGLAIANCNFTYADAASATAAPVISPAVITGC